MPDRLIVTPFSLDTPRPELEILATTRGGSRVRLVANPRDLAGVFDAGAPLHVHIDADIIDPSEAPAMTYPVKGGPSAAELREALRALAGKARIVPIFLSTWDPGLDRDGRTGAICLSLLGVLAGK
jgi:arginase family enzyme